LPKTIQAVWKIDATRLVTAIARVTYNIRIAEELAQEAQVTALPLWLVEDIPEDPVPGQ
jgi:predicted RNA polymerase sigma factor